MTFPRIPFVVFVIAAIFAWLAIRTNVSASDLQPSLAVGDYAGTSEQLFANDSVVICHNSTALVPADQTPELFADGTAASVGLILIKEIKRTRSLDDSDGRCNDETPLGARYRTFCFACLQRLELFLTLSSLHVRLQV
jgi:hypothetical protein